MFYSIIYLLFIKLDIPNLELSQSMIFLTYSTEICHISIGTADQRIGSSLF